MADYDITSSSRPIVITDHNPSWAAEFTQVAQRLRAGVMWAEKVGWSPDDDYR